MLRAGGPFREHVAVDEVGIDADLLQLPHVALRHISSGFQIVFTPYKSWPAHRGGAGRGVGRRNRNDMSTASDEVKIVANISCLHHSSALAASMLYTHSSNM